MSNKSTERTAYKPRAQLLWKCLIVSCGLNLAFLGGILMGYINQPKGNLVWDTLCLLFRYV